MSFLDIIMVRNFTLWLLTDVSFLNFFFLRPYSSNSSSDSSLSTYSTFPRSLYPPPYPVLSSISPNLGALQTLQVERRAQLTFAHLKLNYLESSPLRNLFKGEYLVHIQSSALKSPLLFSAASLPISTPSFFTLVLSSETRKVKFIIR